MEGRSRAVLGRIKIPNLEAKSSWCLGKAIPHLPLASRNSFGDPPGAKGAGSQPGWGQVPPWGGSRPLVPLKRRIFAFEKPKTVTCQIFPTGHPRGAGHGAWGSPGRASHVEKGPSDTQTSPLLQLQTSLSAAGMEPAFPGTGTHPGKPAFPSSDRGDARRRKSSSQLPNPTALHLQRALLIPFPTCSRHPQ